MPYKGKEKDKITNNYLQNTTYETKVWTTSNPQKIRSGWKIIIIKIKNQHG